MKTIEQPCFPGQVLALNLKRGNALVAKDGTLRLEYRDQSLDWLLNAAPGCCVKVDEGAQYVLPCDAFVKIQTEGTQAATCIIMRPPSLVARVLAGLNVARPSSRMIPRAEA